jgi:S1-C subfamily serine protease
MYSPRSRLVSGALLALGLTLLSVGHDPRAGEPKKDDKKEKKQDPPKKAPPPSLPAVFSKDQPDSVDDLKAIEAHVRRELEKITPAVVGVRIGNAQGSGVIVTKDGYVLTAGHVSGKPGRDAVIILPNGEMVKAKTLGSKGDIDSGMLKILGSREWPFVEMGKSENLKKGSWVLAIGHPGGFRPNRTPVVRLGRVLFTNEFVIRSDCTIVGGDSGGPLFDMNGQVVGIHSRIGGSITENIHVPILTYRKTWDRLAKGDVWGGTLGQPALVQSAGGKIVYEKEGKLTADDPRDKKKTDCFAQTHVLKVVPGNAYTIDMIGTGNRKRDDDKRFDPFLRLLDSTGKQLADDDDGAGGTNARIVYRPTKADEVRIVATTFEAGQTGSYKLVVRQAEIKLYAGKIDLLPALQMPKQIAPLVLEKFGQAGNALFIKGMLVDAKGAPVAGKEVQFSWEKGQTTIKSNDSGALRLKLSKANVRGLYAELPEGLKISLEFTDKSGTPFQLPPNPDFDKVKVKSAGGKLVFEKKGTLTEKEPLDKLRADLIKRDIKQACFYKVVAFKMMAGSTYTIDLESAEFDSYLRLEDIGGMQLAEDDDGAGKLNSRIVFTPLTDGEYRIIVTTCDPDQYGSYRLAIYLAEAKKGDKSEE